MIQQPFMSFRYTISFSATSDCVGFQNVTGLPENNSQNKTIQSINNLFLKDGLGTKNNTVTQWLQDCISYAGADSMQTKDVVLSLYNDAGEVANQWMLTNAFPNNWNVVSASLKTNDILIENLELSFECLKEL